MTSQTLTYRSVLREIRRLISVATQPDPQTVAALRSLLQQFRLDFLNALDFPVSFFLGFLEFSERKEREKAFQTSSSFPPSPSVSFFPTLTCFTIAPPPTHTHTLLISLRTQRREDTCQIKRYSQAKASRSCRKQTCRKRSR